ncbi:MAG: hypothetical protein R6V10_02515, partial [bacterium]
MGGVKKTLASAGIGASNIVSWYARRMAGAPNVLDINLNGRVEEVQLYGLWQRFLPSPGVGMRELLSGLDLASRDDGIKALVLTVSDHDLDWGRTEELCMMVRRFRESAKYALAYLEAPSNIDTLLAAACGHRRAAGLERVRALSVDGRHEPVGVHVAGDVLEVAH